ncbi:tyrosyl-DNA phosphodiesterase I [Calycina marina]|uniref:Tyrosyl-DNA phosphodiesterase I n=1 Tax=Calycina marina TaxID=1763456 RepID=A0A9P8CHQ8_9HELO|nr:tyrosyl-DNA phosphodiesterase I [Calycina marina]
MDNLAKRRRLDPDEQRDQESKDIHGSLSRPVSPPPLRHQRPDAQSIKSTGVLKSPFQLTHIRDLPDSSNVDAATLKDILGDPLIAECWEFNYLHDLEFLMDQFDSDVKDLVKVHVIHGFWRKEDGSRLRLIGQATKYTNLKLHTAYMPEMFGTHHSKMLILIRHDDTAQVIIHTANMIPFDWTNMTQALWRSPLLPKFTNTPTPSTSGTFGIGAKFKADLLNYLKSYDQTKPAHRGPICTQLVEELTKYDFSEIRAAIVASCPGKQSVETDSETSWGWSGLKNVLNNVPVSGKQPTIIVQISSIATLGGTDKWLDKTLFKTLETSSNLTSKGKFHVIFPTADEVRRSLNGYISGNAIHTKIQSKQQIQQLTYLKPLLCHWAGDRGQPPASGSSVPVSDAGRKRAAPHIKTYIRFTDITRTAIDWMLVTSANLSKQAWGDTVNSEGNVRVCSYEIGVMVWPELFGNGAKMVPTFKTDTPVNGNEEGLVIGARMPYDLPIVPYGMDDEPWCATTTYNEPDWMGQTWPVME